MPETTVTANKESPREVISALPRKLPETSVTVPCVTGVGEIAKATPAHKSTMLPKLPGLEVKDDAKRSFSGIPGLGKAVATQGIKENHLEVACLDWLASVGWRAVDKAIRSRPAAIWQPESAGTRWYFLRDHPRAKSTDP